MKFRKLESAFVLAVGALLTQACGSSSQESSTAQTDQAGHAGDAGQAGDADQGEPNSGDT